ncbi:o-succinylbenzoate synthase [Lactobacillus sp. 3B(2020)]|uniref:o-succinylbenzoate synthase n=1 Tax=Lactobacillus sp. 3B(2020) TaxID=2695882 RepID=UPI0015DF25DD|nr:o-succinylbenzoate synthase [Lactobacillus sp. 3B(2020)]QLL69349.1 o-succinylbenzoate synthase [Lactobacillus sp. 3B(2020)]
MHITAINLWQIDLPLRHPFISSEAKMTTKPALILELTDEMKNHGYGECSAFATPFYTAEFRSGAWAFLTELVLPKLINHSYLTPTDFDDQFAGYQGNEMAKAAVNCALWDLYAKRQGIPLAQALGGVRNEAEAGIAIGLQSDPATLVSKVQSAVNEGYRRVKIKVKPGHDFTYLKAVREKFPDLMLMADANSAYTLADVNHLKQFDSLNLLMLEQPLAAGDLVEHADLQAHIKTPICLDESIVTIADVKAMVKLGAGKVINLKVARVGGLSQAKAIQAYAQQVGIDCWVGGMVDTGIGRAANLALATLPGINLPNDLSASGRFFTTDIITPPVTLAGIFVQVPAQPGIGYQINWQQLRKVTSRKFELK